MADSRHPVPDVNLEPPSHEARRSICLSLFFTCPSSLWGMWRPLCIPSECGRTWKLRDCQELVGIWTWPRGLGHFGGCWTEPVSSIKFYVSVVMRHKLNQWTLKYWVGFLVPAVVVMKSFIFWDITPCSSSKTSVDFRRTTRHYIPEDRTVWNTLLFLFLF
jgi:hypothetical protein